jgi:hypothetical protein
MTAHGEMMMEKPARSRLRRAHDNAVGYHLLVGIVFAGCLPVTLAQSFKPRGTAPHPIATALDTARNTVAQAYSLPG